MIGLTARVYYGEEPWNAARNLHSMLKLPENRKDFVPDYHRNLLAVRESGRYRFYYQEIQQAFAISRCIYKEKPEQVTPGEKELLLKQLS